MLSRKQKQIWRRLEWRLYGKHFGSFWVNVSTSSQKISGHPPFHVFFAADHMGQANVGIAGRVKWIFVVFLIID